MLTKRQKQILDFITSFSKKHGFAPSFAEIKKRMKLRSLATIHEHISTLEQKGVLERTKRQARSIVASLAEKMVQVPLLGRIAAGVPIEAIEDKETIAVPQSKLPFSRGNYYALRVAGNSMVDEHINDGDIVLVKEQKTAENGQKVVALLNNSEATLKTFYKEKNRIRLQPANKAHSPIFVDKKTPLAIQGVVIDVIQNHIDHNRAQFSAKILSPMSLSFIQPYYQRPKFKLYHGNCLDILFQFPENSVDMVFADPPYLLSNGGFSVHAGRRVSVNKGIWDKSNGLKDDFEFHLKWIRAVRRVLKPHGTIWISGTYHSIYQCGFALQIAGYHILNDIAWFKPNASPNLSCRFFTASHETILWARKEKKARHIFNYDTMKNGNWPEDFIKKPRMQMRSVWAMGTPKNSEKKFGKHPTQKPQDLLRRIVLASTNKNDLIIDPFTGSSTTGIAAYLSDRNFIGIDTDKTFLDVSIKRFEELGDSINK